LVVVVVVQSCHWEVVVTTATGLVVVVVQSSQVEVVGATTAAALSDPRMTRALAELAVARRMAEDLTMLTVLCIVGANVLEP
jgi:type IV secretory pathway protease TraF